MRVSVNRTDAGYSQYAYVRAAGKRVYVTFNGERQTAVITADSDCGMIVRLLTDAKGDFIFDRDRRAFQDEVLHGKVEIDLYDEVIL